MATGKLQSSGDEAIPNLPGDIVVEILARLPVKSLLRFRCVSEPWRSLISSPSFIKTHLRVATEDSTFSSHRIMFTIPRPEIRTKRCPVRSLVGGRLTNANYLDYPENQPRGPFMVVGSCNGLICMTTRETDVFLWNPATRSSAKLHPVGVDLGPHLFSRFGFGYSESTDDYKVLGIFGIWGRSGVHLSSVKLYSLRANSWKSIDGFKDGAPMDSSGTFASGKLYFMAASGHNLVTRSIVSLDLDSEAYATIEQPNYDEGWFELRLGALGGCICVLCDYQQNRIDFWILKESWAKVAAIPYDNPLQFLGMQPQLMLPNGEILLVYQHHIALYDPNANSWRHCQIHNLSAFLEANVYVESLVSPTVLQQRRAGD